MPCAFHIKRPHSSKILDDGCQFADVDWPLIIVDEQEWCAFHCPMTDHEKNFTEKAAWDEGQQQPFLYEINRRLEAVLAEKAQVSNNPDEEIAVSKNVLDLTGVVFPYSTSFEQTEIPNVLLHRATFSGDVNFHGASFRGDAIFAGATFSGDARFDGVSFSGKVIFTGATFSGDTRFDQVRFNGAAVFAETLFLGEARFHMGTFCSVARFDRVTFSRDVRFDKTRFSGDAWFDEARFGGSASFEVATFGGSAMFAQASFSAIALFFQATFSRATMFSKATFSGDAWFYRAVFSGDAWFDKVMFSAKANFGSVDDGKTNRFFDVDFSHTTFGGEASFENRQFFMGPSFEDCTFHRAPIFHNCILHQGTIFPPRINFLDVTSSTAAQSYRTLKLAMGKFGSRQEEAMFYTLEQQSLRVLPDTPCSQKLFSWFYEQVADYGESFLRPVGWLLILVELFFFLYASSMTLFFPNGIAGYDVASFRFTLEQTVRPFGAWGLSGKTAFKDIFGESELLPLPLPLLATLQSIVSLTLLTLFILAVRRRFKL